MLLLSGSKLLTCFTNIFHITWIALYSPSLFYLLCLSFASICRVKRQGSLPFHYKSNSKPFQLFLQSHNTFLFVYCLLRRGYFFCCSLAGSLWFDLLGEICWYSETYNSPAHFWTLKNTQTNRKLLISWKLGSFDQILRYLTSLELLWTLGMM